MLFLFAILWGLSWKKKALDGNIKNLEIKKDTKPKKVVSLNDNLSQIKNSNDCESILKALQSLAYNQYKTKKNASLDEILEMVTTNNSDIDKENLEICFDKINSALYANKNIDFSLVKETIIKELKKKPHLKKGKENKEKLSSLNPT